MKLSFEPIQKDYLPFLKHIINPKRTDLEVVERELRSAFRRNFNRQGNAKPWKELAPATLKERKRLGFAPGPKLVRRGNYRDSITTSKRGYSKYTRRKSGWDYEAGSRHRYVEALELGVPARNLPSRPAIALTRADLTKLDKVMDSLLTRLENRK